MTWVPLSIGLAVLSAQGAPTVEQCVAASGEGQRLQREGHLFEARQQLTVCSDTRCPTIVQSECVKWLAAALEAQPTVVVVARLDGVDQRAARVLLDGHLWLNQLDGRPASIDPGDHELTLTVANQTRSKRLVANIAEKNRLVLFEFASPAPGLVLTPQPGPAPQPTGRVFPMVPVVLTSVAVAGGALFAGLGASGRSDLALLVKEPCAATKTCDPARTAEVQRRFLLADVSLGVGVAAAAVAAWQWWRWSQAPVVVTPTADGAAVSVVGRF